MKQNIAGKQLISSAAVILVSLVVGLGVLSGCFNPRADIRIPDIPPIPPIPAAGAATSELGYGTLATTDGRKTLGWWRIDNNSKTYQRHAPPTTRSGRPTGFERTLEVIPDKRVLGFKPK
ncbi:MAG: hypothetical protein QGH60_15605 [Phycisphaerae bacterium]|jgi:hypothetical protein|nr:hypothetical protein [Phycisphaerae bacterium]